MTLIELLLVIVIAGVLAAIAMPAYSRFVQSARNSRAIADISEIRVSIERYRLNAGGGSPPLSLTDIGAGAKLDPWGNPYSYLNFSTVSGLGRVRKDRNLVPINSEFDLYSKGADGRSLPPLTTPVSQDDIIMANDGSFIGKASDY